MSSWARLFVLGRKSRSLPLVNVVELEGDVGDTNAILLSRLASLC